MTNGPRTAIRIRRVTCGGCRKSFIPKRRDAIYCSDRCQKREYRRIKANAERVFQKKDFKTVLKIANATAKKRDWYRQWSAFGSYREEWCRNVAEEMARGVSNVRFIGTMYGVFALEDKPGAIQIALDEIPWRVNFEDAAELVECSLTDPRLIRAILYGVSRRRQRDDSKLRAEIFKGVSRVILFSIEFGDDPEPAPRASRDTPDGWDGEFEPEDHGGWSSSLDPNEVFGGDGYSIK
jgi:hypothetical protein